MERHLLHRFFCKSGIFYLVYIIILSQQLVFSLSFFSGLEPPKLKPLTSTSLSTSEHFRSKKHVMICNLYSHLLDSRLFQGTTQQQAQFQGLTLSAWWEKQCTLYSVHLPYDLRHSILDLLSKLIESGYIWPTGVFTLHYVLPFRQPTNIKQLYLQEADKQKESNMLYFHIKICHCF